MRFFLMQLAWMLCVTIWCWTTDCIPIEAYLGLVPECATPFGRLAVNMVLVIGGLLVMEALYFLSRRRQKNRSCDAEQS